MKRCRTGSLKSRELEYPVVLGIREQGGTFLQTLGKTGLPLYFVDHTTFETGKALIQTSPPAETGCFHSGY